MDLTILALEQEKARLEEKRAILEQYLERNRDLKDLRLVANVQRRKHRSYYYLTRLHEPARKYLGLESNELVRRIKQYQTARACCDSIQRKLEMINAWIFELRPLDDSMLSRQIPKTYHSPEDLLSEILSAASGAGTSSFQTWKRAAETRLSTQEPLFPENLRHRCSNGLVVRSKSEIIIVEMLLNCGVPFFYELEHDFRGLSGRPVRPDFTLYSKVLDREFIWEHFGMMTDEHYAENADGKIRIYARNGYHLGENLIVTYDKEDGALDVRHINSLINGFLR